MELIHPAAQRGAQHYINNESVRYIVDSDVAVRMASQGRLETAWAVLKILWDYSPLELSEVQDLLARVKTGSEEAHCRAVELLAASLERRVMDAAD
jgi:hypothetical protein